MIMCFYISDLTAPVLRRGVGRGYVYKNLCGCKGTTKYQPVFMLAAAAVFYLSSLY